MTPTPETDAVIPNEVDSFLCMQSRCRKLERERNEMRNALENIEDRFVDGENTYDDWLFMGTTARTVLAKLRNHLR
jgi:hypothetical protein